MCLKYDQGVRCFGAGGGRLRRVCVLCPNYYKDGMEVDQDGNRNRDQLRGDGCGIVGADPEQQEGNEDRCSYECDNTDEAG